MQLNLRHRIENDILIYPGYVPAPGVKYRVFHYGLRFSVGNWSFDKADWREVDMVNRCWAEFPNPPDPSTLDHADEDARERDLLSIECITTLNQGLRLHHKRRNCLTTNSLSTSEGDKTEERGISRKLGDFNQTFASRNNHISENQHEDLASDQKDGMLTSFKFWVIVLWGFSGMGFLAVIFVVYSGHKRRGTRIKHHRSRRRSLYPGYMEVNGRDRLSRGVDVPL